MAYVAPIQTIAEIIPKFGSPSWPAFQSLNVTIAAAATTTTLIPASSVLTFNGANVTMKKGYIRARFSNVAATPTLQLTVTATDGTLTTTLFTSAVSAALSTTAVVEFIIPFLSELLLNKFTFAATTVGAAGTMTADYEVTGNP